MLLFRREQWRHVTVPAYIRAAIPAHIRAAGGAAVDRLKHCVLPLVIIKMLSGDLMKLLLLAEQKHQIWHKASLGHIYIISGETSILLRKGSASTGLWESPRVPSERYEPRPCLCVFVACFDRRIFFTIHQKRIRGGGALPR